MTNDETVVAPRLVTAQRTHRGLVREANEDSVHTGANVLALADGMGGHAAGEVASALMIAALASLEHPGEGDLLSRLEQAVLEGNAAIADRARQSSETEGMGTTLSALLFDGTRFGLAHVGDSRVYRLRGGQLSQLTHDDTFVQALVDAGHITAEQARTHPRRSLIMRALTGAVVAPTLTLEQAEIGDRFLLCSDGLSDVVGAEHIERTMAGARSVEECAAQLIELALDGGGPDNVTVVVADLVAAI
ncbi:serine/threonine protein phosphatase PrpC [Nocardia neocaledoniensis]|uniref:Serine/threonine protein phosphatase PrpC n=1 Tax=Nocardia neocaledoniensis TaxID=236511 RepID=A0A317NF89_9NOCA|nr:serine/threonine protein phosphatase PrpC [Nocardia neocaledoniensis]